MKILIPIWYNSQITLVSPETCPRWQFCPRSFVVLPLAQSTGHGYTDRSTRFHVSQNKSKDGFLILTQPRFPAMSTDSAINSCHQLQDSQLLISVGGGLETLSAHLVLTWTQLHLLRCLLRCHVCIHLITTRVGFGPKGPSIYGPLHFLPSIFSPISWA